MLADDFSDMEDPLFRAALQSIVKPDVKDEEYTVEDKKKDFNQDEEYTVEDKKKDFNKSDEGYTVEEKKEPPPWSTPGPLPPPPLPPPSPPPLPTRIRGHASREGDGRYYEMFGSRRAYERMVRNKYRGRRGSSYWSHQRW